MLMGNAGQTAKPLGQIDATQDSAAESSIAGQTWKIGSDARFGSSATRGFPAALPVVAGGSAAQVAVVTYNFTPGSDPLQVAPEILGPDGKPRKADIQVVRRSDRERGGARTLLLSFKPEGLEPGRYALRVKVSDRAQKTAEASGEFEVRAP
jgi:hypothetical protein